MCVCTHACVVRVQMLVCVCARACVHACVYVIQTEFLLCEWFPIDALDDDMCLGHTKRNSRTQIYAGRKVHYLTGLLILTVWTFPFFMYIE